MNSDRNPLFWSFPLGTWFAVRVRLSMFFLLLVPVLCYRLDDTAVGIAFSVVLFLSVLAHEFGHVFAARVTGGDGDEIHVTPLGGLATCYPAPTFQSRFWTIAGGPTVNVALCLISLVQVLNSNHLNACLNPFVFPPVSLAGDSSSVVAALVLMLFQANWLLLLINLLPVHPLDGGRMLSLVLNARLDSYVARIVYLRIGGFLGLMMLVMGLFYDNTWVMAVGAVILPLNLAEGFQGQSSHEGEESFMGYDFSQGYTSLEQSLPEDYEGGEDRPGMLARWKAQREEERLRRQEEEDRDMEKQLDQLLDKLHSGGEDALSPAEKRRLQDISARLRERGRQT